MTDLKPAIAYVRQSQGRDGETRDNSLSLEQQVDSIKQWADQHGYQVERYIRDHDVTGRTLDRPGLSELREMVRPGVTVIVWKYDRLARSVGGHSILVDELADSGATVISVTEPQGKLPRQMMSVISEYYSDALSERLVAIREAQARRGDWTGGQPPYGYWRRDVTTVMDKHGNPRERRSGPVVVNPDESIIVREIFRRYLDGAAMFELTMDLARRGVPRPLGGQWEIQMVRRLLANPFYCGLVTHKGAIVATGTHEPLIDRATWNSVQERIARQATIRRRSPNDAESWLEGLVIHACGSRMHLTMINGKVRKDGSQDQYPNFVCYRSSGVKRCGLKQIVISQRKVEAAVRARLVHDLATIAPIDVAIERAKQAAGGDDAALKRRALMDRRRVIDHRFSRARELWLSGDDSLDQWKAEKSAHDLASAQLDREMAAIPTAPDPDRYRETAAHLAGIAPLVATASDAALRRILEPIGVAVVSVDGVTIRYGVPFGDFLG